MTPAEWENMSSVAHGSFDSAFDRVKQTLLSLKPHERFAVYADYGLEPSTAETLPKPVLTDARDTEYRHHHQPRLSESRDR